MAGRYLKKQAAAPKKKRGLKICLIVLAVILAIVLLFVAVVGVLFAVSPSKGMSVVKFLASPFTKYYAGYVNTVDDIPATDPTIGDPSGVDDPYQSSEGDEMATDPSDASDPSEATEETWPEIVSTQNVTTIMLVGQNYREGEESYLSDTMIMCTINRDTNTLTMTSLLRDLYVPLPAYAGHGPGRNRINVCYHLGTQWTGSVKGGMEMLALCVEQNFGIPIDHTIEVDFVAFEKVIDLMGGVEIELTEAEANYLNSDACAYYGFDKFEPGLQTLNGLEALAYARIRSIDSDFARTNRQRTLINSLIEKCKTMGLWDLHKLATEVLPLVTTDMTTDEINNYIWEFLPMLADLNVVSLKVPLEKDQMNGDWSYNGKEVEGIGNVLEPNLWSHKKYLQQLLGYADVEQ